MPLFPISPDQLERSPDVELEFLRSSGPGGQNVNKVSTAVRLRFTVHSTPLLPEDVRRRLILRAGRRMTDEGELIIEARRHRTQERNRSDALFRLAELIAESWRPPRPRRPTKPTLAARQRRLDRKKRRGTVKQTRKTVHEEKG
ncbi:alternative ribosome rescue aminoacyl-tRNA hydrolase ArfB [Desulfonatronum sp. SC1]|uniref:alternative ribosome rescue aminoacyl-tRNA hydrolase ArfB n=1 Tax=Desulfonatronum sp. SC1 TaxID=2109626 RepID=UPI000D3012DA|nr:alternative ribosome rescue aminoacyl-tRNA hydrolase ArfB [Desulfonatronum sp. SC1]PTN38448.1 aminoacyl-tRNA hydrolase [Desulfonatronum sp. SC1]